VTTGDRWFAITNALRPLFMIRIAGGALVAFGLFLFVANIMRTSSMGDDADREVLPFEIPEPEPVKVLA
jgi:cbb3-type cytochrome oxidase subunit 1